MLLLLLKAASHSCPLAADSSLRDTRSPGEEYPASSGYTPQIHCLRLSALGEQFYRENWQRYRELYLEVDGLEPENTE
jgi:hypothetical protein